MATQTAAAAGSKQPVRPPVTEHAAQSLPGLRMLALALAVLAAIVLFVLAAQPAEAARRC